MRINSSLLSGLVCLISLANATRRIQIQVFELFSTKIDHNLFNWTTSNAVTDKFDFRPSLENYPDLPHWVRYSYSEEHRAGFIYGTPPDKVANQVINIEIVALNRQTFETRIQIISLEIIKKSPARNIVHMKIDNLDWVHLMDPGRIENLKNIFRKDLWPESATGRLEIVFLESAVKMGGRLPVSPQLTEGVIVHLGSNEPFSARLKELQDEVKPLYKMASCTFKKTSVQKIFENGGFKLDWCAFKIIEHQDSAIEEHSPTHHGSELVGIGKNVIEQWQGLKSTEAPERNYIDELAFAIAIPGMILAILVGVLSGVLCFYHDAIRDDYSEFFFDNIFHLCTDSRDRRKIPTTVVHLADSSTNQPKTTTTTLKSLRDAPPGVTLDDISLNSQSPSPSFARDETPISSNHYMRPNPPPYNRTGTLAPSSQNGHGGDDI